MFSNIFPEEDRIKLNPSHEQIIPRINNALQFANFSTIPQKISNKLKLILKDYPFFTFRSVMKELVPLIANDQNRIDDINKLENIDMKIWEAMLNRLDDTHHKDTITLNKSLFNFHPLTHIKRLFTNIF